MSANINGNDVRQLDRRALPDEQVTEEQVQQPDRLARVLMGLLRDVAILRRRWWPQRIDYENRALDNTGTTLHKFPHGLGSHVRFWVVDWDGATSPNVRRDATSDDNTLVLTSTSTGTATIRVEEAG